MTNNTPIYWQAGSLSLHTYAWSVDTFGGRRYTPPDKRGDDLVMPFRRGKIPVPQKFRDAQQLTLSMWLKGVNQDGSIDNTKTTEQKLHENWQTLMAALDTEDPFTLTKRFWLGTSAKVVTGKAELIGGLEPTSSGDLQRFSVELLMNDPYFYEAISSQAIGTVTIQGDSLTDHIIVTFTNGVNPRITFPGGNWVQYNGTVGGTPVVIDLFKGIAKVGSTPVNGLITRNNNFFEWPTMKPGSNALVLGGTGSPAGTFTYDAAYK